MAKLIDITGKALSGEWGIDDETGDGVPVLRTTNFTNEGVVNYNDVITRTITKKNIDQKFLRKGDIIIEKSGGSDKFPVGRVIYFDGDENTYLFNNFTGLLRVKDKKIWNSKYVFYSLFANYRRGGTRAFENKTTGIHNLKTDDFVSRFDIYELPIKEQNLICEKLDKIYNIIKLRRQELLILDDLIKARFVEMFGDPQINPFGWDVVNISEVVGGKISNGFFAKRDDYIDDGNVSVLGVANIVNRMYSKVDELPKTNADDKDIEKFEVRYGDMLFCRSSLVAEGIGKASIIPENVQDNILFECHVIRLPLDLSKCVPEFMQTLSTMDFFRNQVVAQSKTATMTTIGQEGILRTDIILPPIDKQREFYDFVRQTDKSKFLFLNNYKYSLEIASTPYILSDGCCHMGRKLWGKNTTKSNL